MTSNPSSAGVGGLTAAASSIDWASLAQQWIQMRDNSNTEVELSGMFCQAMPAAPPPPNISGVYHVATAAPAAAVHSKTLVKKSSTYEEQGEADMEMDDDDDAHVGRQIASNSTSSASSINLGDAVTTSLPGLMQPQWLMQQQLRATAPPTLDLGRRFIHPPPPMAPPVLVPAVPQINVAVAAAAAAAIAGAAVNPTAHIPSLMKINVPNPHEIKAQPDAVAPVGDEAGTSSAVVAGTCTMDAAKRKMLPAWIREGLEKMEREKQRQIEREQQTSNASDDEASSQVLADAPVEHMVKAKIPTKLLVAASESSGNEDEEVRAASQAVHETKAKKSREKKAARVALEPDVGTDATGDDDDDKEDRPLVFGKSFELKMADLMIVVRRTLTELLLEVTNEEIANVAQDTIKWRKTQASSAQVIRKSAFSSITDKLGLAAYDDSSSSDGSNSASDAEATDNDTQKDSEEELKASIRMKRRAFAKIAEEIEERVADAAIQEEQKIKHYAKLELEEETARNKRDTAATAVDRGGTSRHHHHHHGHHGDGGGGCGIGGGGKGYDKEFGETTESKLQQSNGKRAKERLSRKERTTRFSDNKDSKSTSIAAAASYMSQLAKSTAAKPALAAPKAAPAAAAATTSASADLNSMYTTTATYAAAAAALNVGGAGMNSVLNAVETAYENAVKMDKTPNASDKQPSRSQSERERAESRSDRKRRGHRRRSTDDDDDDSSSSSSTGTSSTSSSSSDSSDGSSSSPHSKYSRASSSHAKSNRRKRSSRSRSRSRSHKRSSQHRSKRSRHESQHNKRRHDSDHHRRRDHNNDSARRAHRPTTSRRSASRSRSRSSYSSSSRRRH